MEAAVDAGQHTLSIEDAIDSGGSPPQYTILRGDSQENTDLLVDHSGYTYKQIRR